jgi:hypothetical protein
MKAWGAEGRRWTLCLLLGLVACSGGGAVVSLEPPRVDYTHKDYERVRERWTRRALILKALDTTLQVHATFYSADFAAAFVAENAHLFKLPAAERANLARKMEEERNKTHTFFISAETSDYRWNDFDRSESIWRIALLNDRGEQVSTVDIKRPRDITATLMELFPFIGGFSRVYTIRFPSRLPDGRPLLGADANKAILRFSGPLGCGELSWHLR